ncbi:MAG: LamG-like jellyroll fold domain-containing protein, partial [Ktedonobacteraceae bacterium]
TYNGTTATLYGNGVQLAQMAKAWNTVDSGGTFIGNDYSNHVWSGNIDEVSYYTRALSAAEVSDLYHNYGYATHGDQGHELITSYSAPPPIATAGNGLGIYMPSGTWQSNAFSLGNNLGWGDGTTGSSTAFSATVLNVSSTATIQFQIRVATNSAGLASASYVSLGTATSNATFTLTKAQLDALGLTTGSGEFLQVEAVLTNTGANTNTPQLDSCTISYGSGS